MGGLEPPTQSPRACAANNIFARADARALGGQVKPGHGEF
jgi:hypothetical protein